jgi:hypothetical protein
VIYSDTLARGHWHGDVSQSHSIITSYDISVYQDSKFHKVIWQAMLSKRPVVKWGFRL